MIEEAWPYQWSAVLENGTKVETRNGRQARARSFGSKVAVLHVYKLGRKKVPFGIPIPPDAEVVIFRRHRITTRGDHSTRYFFGWESPEKTALWEFGNDYLKHHGGR